MTQWDLEVLAAELRRHSDDLSPYARFLLSTLSSALPPELVEGERRGGLLGRRAGDDRMEAEADVVGADGIVAVRLAVELKDWCSDIAEFLAVGTAVKTSS